MIIQAGFDLQLLARPHIAQDGVLNSRLVLICIDSEMQLTSVYVVADDFSGSLEPFRDKVLEALDAEFTKYFAIAHPGRFSEEFWAEEPIEVEARALGLAARERGFHLIGHFAVDESGLWSAMVHSYFDQYPSHEDLPRTMFHWSHSEFGECG